MGLYKMVRHLWTVDVILLVQFRLKFVLYIWCDHIVTLLNVSTWIKYFLPLANLQLQVMSSLNCSYYLNSFRLVCDFAIYSTAPCPFFILKLSKSILLSCHGCSSVSSQTPVSAWLVGRIGRLSAGVQYKPPSELNSTWLYI